MAFGKKKTPKVKKVRAKVEEEVEEEDEVEEEEDDEEEEEEEEDEDEDEGLEDQDYDEPPKNKSKKPLMEEPKGVTVQEVFDILETNQTRQAQLLRSLRQTLGI